MTDSAATSGVQVAGSASAPRGRLRRRLLGWFVGLSLVPLLLSNGLGYLRSERILEGLVERYLAGIADLEALHVRDQVERHVLFLQQIAGSPALRRVGEGATADASVDAFLAERMAEPSLSAFEALYVYASDGTIFASAPLPPSDLAFWLDPPLSRPQGPFEVVRDSGPASAPHLRLAVPLNRAEATSLTYLGATIEVIGAPDFIQLPEHTAGSVETFVVDESGLPVFVSHPHGHVDFGLPLANPLLDRPEGSTTVYRDASGTEVVGVMVPVPDRPWSLITEVPVSDALEELRQLRQVSIWLAVLLGLLVLALSWLVARRVVAPVGDLVFATRRLAGGDLDTRVQVRTDDEIGELGSAFNDMAEELESTSRRAREFHERELARAGQLATVGELASSVAHEIKNPVAGIAGGLDLVTRRTRDDPGLTKIVDEMQRQVKRIDLAVRDLLSFARPKMPALARTDIADTVERAFTLVSPTASKQGVVLRRELDPAVPTIRADPDMIVQALVNLIVNAVQATNQGGRVTVSAAPADTGVEIRVEDTGQGIPAEELEQIFKPFYTTRHQGTGLGLSITRSLIERHGGSIRVQSEVGEGTIFVVRLPATPPGAEDPR